MRISLRAKLALISLLLLLLPLLGFRLNSSLKASLMSSREDALNLTALAVSAALNNRADLFVEEQFHSLQQDRDLYLFQLSNPIQLNGEIEDWLPEFKQATAFGREHLLGGAGDFIPGTLAYRHIAGKQGDYLYALFEVTDDHVVYRARESLRVDRSDHLQIVIGDDNGPRTYVVPGYEPGWVIGFLVPASSAEYPVVERRIHGKWKQTDTGYTLEIRMHQDILGSRLAFAVVDVDDVKTRDVRAVIGTAAGADEEEQPGWLLTTSTTIETILQSLDRPDARIRVVDRNQRIRAEVGGLRDSPVHNQEEEDLPARLMTFMHDIFLPFFQLFTSPFSTDIEESASQPAEIDMQGIRDGLDGSSSIVRYRMNGGLVEVMAGIAPVYDGEEIVAVAVVEQTTNSILSLSNQLIEETLFLSVVAFLIGGGAIFVFALIVSTRIRALRNQADASITEDGRIVNAISATTARDEIGDLGRTLNTMLVQLREQVDYRERMADNLEHEMRTPLAGVAASLKNIEEELGGRHPELLDYLDGAHHNTRRLHELLTAIREGVTLKESLAHERKEEIDFGEALSRWLEFIWAGAYPDVDFVYRAPEQPIMVKGEADRLLQAIDKIIENAVSHRSPDTAIELILRKTGGRASLQVINLGSTIDPTLQNTIFDYMVSSRVSKDRAPHLGLGLYIAKTIIEHHDGSLTGTNLADGREGVEFRVELPVR